MNRFLHGGCGALAGAVLTWSGGVLPAARAAPVRYEMQATTLSGLGAVAGGGLSGGAMMRILMGGQPTAVRSLDLTLRAGGPPPASPRAEHRVPEGLGLGPSLALLTPAPASPGEPDRSPPADRKLPEGRLLVYRGCAEAGLPPDPEVLDFATLVPDQQALARALAQSGRLASGPDLARSAGAPRSGSAVVGHWPEGTASPAIPATGSLVGSHGVSSNYAPEIAFAIGREHDFLAPVQLQSTAAAGAWRLSWQAIPTVQGYQALVTGPGLREGDVVIWSSSQKSGRESPLLGAFPMAALAAAPGGSADAATLVRDGVWMGPERTSCTVPRAVMGQMQAGILHFTAFGNPLVVQDPGPAAAWQVALQRQSMLIQPLVEGLPGTEPGDSGAGEPPQRQGGGGAFNLFRGLF